MDRLRDEWYLILPFLTTSEICSLVCTSHKVGQLVAHRVAPLHVGLPGATLPHESCLIANRCTFSILLHGEASNPSIGVDVWTHPRIRQVVELIHRHPGYVLDVSKLPASMEILWIEGASIDDIDLLPTACPNLNQLNLDLDQDCHVDWRHEPGKGWYIWKEELFRGSIASLSRCQKLEVLWMGSWFNQEISFLQPLSNLKELVLGDSFNHPIDALSSLVQLISISFGRSFDQSIEPLRPLAKLEKLVITSDRFDRPIDVLSNLRELRHIRFVAITHPIHCLAGLPHLEHLELGFMFNQSLEPLRRSTSLKRLVIGSACFADGHRTGAFNQSVEPICSLPNLEELIIGGAFDQSVEELVRLPSLTTLWLGTQCSTLPRFTPSSPLQRITIEGNVYLGHLTAARQLQHVTLLQRDMMHIDLLLKCPSLQSVTMPRHIPFDLSFYDSLHPLDNSSALVDELTDTQVVYARC